MKALGQPSGTKEEGNVSRKALSKVWGKGEQPRGTSMAGAGGTSRVGREQSREVTCSKPHESLGAKLLSLLLNHPP